MLFNTLFPQKRKLSKHTFPLLLFSIWLKTLYKVHKVLLSLPRLCPFVPHGVGVLNHLLYAVLSLSLSLFNIFICSNDSPLLASTFLMLFHVTNRIFFLIVVFRKFGHIRDAFCVSESSSLEQVISPMSRAPSRQIYWFRVICLQLPLQRRVHQREVSRPILADHFCFQGVPAQLLSTSSVTHHWIWQYSAFTPQHRRKLCLASTVGRARRNTKYLN